MDLRSVYVSNCIGIVLLIILRFASRTKVARKGVEDRIHTFMVFGTMLGCVMEIFSYTIDGKCSPAPGCSTISPTPISLPSTCCCPAMKDMDERMYGVKLQHHRARDLAAPPDPDP